MEAVNESRVLDARSVLVVAPTSSGKTFVGEMAGAKAIADGRKAAFLLPFKALTNEKCEDFEALYGERLGLRVVRCTGDHHDDVDNFVRGRYDIALLTYEMFLNLSLAFPSLLIKIGLVVLDEAQFVADPWRGRRLPRRRALGRGSDNGAPRERPEHSEDYSTPRTSSALTATTSRPSAASGP